MLQFVDRSGDFPFQCTGNQRIIYVKVVFKNAAILPGENLIWGMYVCRGRVKEMPEVNGPSVAKVIELIGSSPKGWDDAAANAVKEAAKTVRNIRGVYLKECTAKVENNKIVEYRSNVKISFVVDKDS
jgi:flavin-binding protein dodecin